MSAESFLSGLPIIGGLFDDSEEKALRELEESKKIWRDVRPDDVGFEYFTPEEYEFQTIADDPQTIAMQREHLSKLAGLADTGLSEQDAAALDMARSEAGRMARGNREAALTNAQARGVAGGGLEFALGEVGSQEAAERARRAAFDEASQTARQRALYQTAFGDSLSGFRDQSFRNNAANTDVINQFNTLNTAATNDARMDNITRKADTIRGNNAQQMDWAGGMTNQYNQMAGAYGAQNAARSSDRNANTGLAMTALGYGTVGKKKKPGEP